MMKLTARAIKVGLVLDPAELAAAPEPPGGRVVLQIRVADSGRIVTADVASKAVRKARATILEHSADQVALLVQGKLGSGNEVIEAGLVAQVKVPKQVEAK